MPETADNQDDQSLNCPVDNILHHCSLSRLWCEDTSCCQIHLYSHRDDVQIMQAVSVDVKLISTEHDIEGANTCSSCTGNNNFHN